MRLALAAVVALLLAVCPLARGQTGTAVEYYYAEWNYYFVTSFPDEIAYLDGGAFGGVWQRTGQTFNVWTGPTGGALPTCRFFSTNFAPKSSHFYTPVASECSSLQTNSSWQYESIAFYLQVPSEAGVCPANTVALYRLYNNGMGGAPNHRYTTNATTFSQMIAAGWVYEGNGATAAFACVPADGAAAQAPEGVYFGTTSLNQSWVGILLDNGTFYVIYSAPRSTDLGGVVYGEIRTADEVFMSSNAVDFAIGSDVYPVSVSGSYIARDSLTGATSELGQIVSFTATYDPSYQQAASLAALAGSYSGYVASSAGWQLVTFSVNPTGAISGSGDGCSFAGTAAPHGNVNLYDLSVRSSGGVCVFGTSMLSGIGYFDAATRTIYAAAPNADRTDGFLLIGSR